MVEYKHKELTSEIINAVHTVHNALGYGFLEKVYHKSLLNYLKATGLEVGLIINFGPSVEVKRMVL